MIWPVFISLLAFRCAMSFFVFSYNFTDFGVFLNVAYQICPFLEVLYAFFLFLSWFVSFAIVHFVSLYNDSRLSPILLLVADYFIRSTKQPK